MNLTPPDPTRQALIKSLYSRLNPGSELRVAAILLDQINLDYYLSGHTGSACSLGYRIPGARPDDFKNWVLFKLEPNENANFRTFVDTDRRYLYNYESFTGLYTLKS